MKVEITSVNSFQKQLAFVVPPDRVASQMEVAYKRLGDRVKMPGFRPGKTPRKVLEARFAPQIQAEVANDLIQQSFRDALVDHQLNPISQPNVADTSEVDAEGGFRFTITVEVRPEIELTEYTGLEIVFPKTEVTADEVQRSITARLESHAKLEEVTDRPVQSGDLAMVELSAKDGDTVVANELGTMIKTDGDPYYPGVESLVIGLSVDESKTGEVTFGADARTPEVAGRTLQVTVKVITISSRRVPELTDELATEFGYEGGAAGMRTTIESRLRNGREELARNQARANLVEAIIAKNPFEVPAALVEQSFRLLIDELRMQTAMRTGRDPKTVGFSEAQVQDLRMRSTFAAKASLIIEWVANKEKIEVEPADIEARYQQLATERGQTVEAVRGWFQKDDEAAGLRERVREEKVLDWLLERAKF